MDANRNTAAQEIGLESAYSEADGLRRSSQVDSGSVTRYAYDGTMMVREFKQNGQGAWQAAATYLTGPRGMEYRRDDNAGTIRWYVYDGLGSVVGELDPAGNLTAGKKYDVYGAERSGGTGTATTRQGFCGSLGHIADAETGLVYMRARYYDPNVGRFVSEDSKQNGENWFIYCDNNPINKVDQTGKSASGLIVALMVLAFLMVFVEHSPFIEDFPQYAEKMIKGADEMYIGMELLVVFGAVAIASGGFLPIVGVILGLGALLYGGTDFVDGMMHMGEPNPDEHRPPVLLT